MNKEERYIVFKLSDIEKYIGADKFFLLRKLIRGIEAGRERDEKKPFDCVVIEHDWPEYEKVWEMLSERMDK